MNTTTKETAQAVTRDTPETDERFCIWTIDEKGGVALFERKRGAWTALVKDTEDRHMLVDIPRELGSSLEWWVRDVTAQARCLPGTKLER